MEIIKPFMSLSSSTIIYTFANGVIAVVGLGLTIAIGKILGPDGFGIWASFFAAQNIWAALGFMRLETRFAICTSIYQANRIMYAGFFAGLLVTSILAVFLFIILEPTSTIWLALMSGFGLSVFDVISLRKAYEGRHISVLITRCARALFPLLVAVAASLAGATVTEVIAWQGGIGIIFALIVWGKWLKLRRWWRLSVDVVYQYKHGLLPSLIMSLLNGIWINGLTPALNHLTTSALAGQFAMLQRLVGGALGLLSTAITLGMLKRDFVVVHWPTIRNVLTMNVIVSVSLCLLLAIPLLSEAKILLGVGWTFAPILYWATCAFLVGSFSIGAISIVAIRLKDEWFLTIWQLVALLCWGGIYALMPSDLFVVPALWFGCALYILLGMRWRHLANRKKDND